MRYILLLAVTALGFSACKKDKFETVPAITYKNVSPNSLLGNIPITGQALPILTFHLTDAEGDIGFKAGSDTSKVYLKNLTTNKEDSLFLPTFGIAAGKNFEADIDVNLVTVIGPSTRPAPKVDTLYFEVYVKDFAKNKSNVIKAGPVYYIFP